MMYSLFKMYQIFVVIYIIFIENRLNFTFFKSENFLIVFTTIDIGISCENYEDFRTRLCRTRSCSAVGVEGDKLLLLLFTKQIEINVPDNFR